MNNNVKALKSGIWYTISNFITQAIYFLTTPIFARLLTRTEFGIYNNYISWLSIVTIIVTLNLESTLVSARFDYEKDLDGYILSMLTLSSVNTLVWLGVVNIGRTFFASFLDLDIIYINAMLVYLMFYPAINMFLARERFRYDYKKTALTSLLFAGGTTLVSVLLVVNLDNRLMGRIVGIILPTVMLGVFFVLFFIKKAKGIKLIHWRYAIPICLPYIPHLLSMTLLNSIDKVMITKYCGTEQTALYGLAYTCGSMVTILVASLNSAFSPWLGEKLNKEEYIEVRKFSYIYISAFVFMSIGIMLISPEVLYILGGESYMEARYVLAPVSMGCVCQFVYTMFVNVEQFKKKTCGMAIGSATAALLNFVLNMIFIPKIGFLAAAYTTLVGYVVLLLIHMYLVKRLGLKEIYDYKFIGFVVLFGILTMILITILYSYAAIRYIVIAVYSAILFMLCFKYKNQILGLLKNKIGV